MNDEQPSPLSDMPNSKSNIKLLFYVSELYKIKQSLFLLLIPQEEEKSPFCQNDSGNSKVAGNLFTNEGLQPSFRDLDQIFDNSDTSSDETV